MSLGEALAESRRILASASIPDAEVEAPVLLMHATGMTREQLYASLSDELTKTANHALESARQRRLRREPLPYITGHREFFGLDLLVDARVLIPRQETESLVAHVIQIAKERHGESCRIADIGTGSGAIAVSLAVNLPEAIVSAIDASAGALGVASANCRRHGVHDRVVLSKGDLLTPLEGPVDIVVANLPYIPRQEWESLQPEIRLHEPKDALVSGEEGLDHVRRLLDQARSRETPPAWIALELGEGQAATVVREAKRCFPGAAIEVFHDLAGLERGVIMQLQR